MIGVILLRYEGERKDYLPSLSFQQQKQPITLKNLDIQAEPSCEKAMFETHDSNHSLKVEDIEKGVVDVSSEEPKTIDDSAMNGSDSHGEDHHDNDSHGHHEPATQISLLASAVVCFIIYFVFCIVFSSVVWVPKTSSISQDETIDPPYGIPQGVGINLMGIAIGSAFFAWKSGCKAIIAGPDLLPVVFFAEAGISVITYLASQSNDYDPCSDESDYGRRFLGGGEGDPCDPNLRYLAAYEPTVSPDLVPKVVPTTLVAMIIGNLFTALVFYGLGKMKNTANVIGFIPASVVGGFLTCIGYKVIKLAVLITTGFDFKQQYVSNLARNYSHANDPWLVLTIAGVYGVSLYALKRSHIIAAEKLIMGFIVIPLVLFFAICAMLNKGMGELRQEEWFITQNRDGLGCTDHCAFTRTNFWQTLGVAYGGLFSNLIEWGAVPRCMPIFIMGSCITSLDNMLKLTSSEKALGIDLDYNQEMMLGGQATLVSSIFAGAPAYGQTKFNVINFSIARTAESPLPTIYLGGICFLVFLSGVAGNIINFMPKFLLGGLCVFAGVGFLYENLWEGRKNLNRVSFAIVWVIFLVNMVWEFFILQNFPDDIQPMVPGLLVVFVLGLVLSAFEFMFAFMHKAKPLKILSGDKCCSTAIRSEKHDNQLAIMSPWYQVFCMDSFIFFGTANDFYQRLKQHIFHQKETKPKAERTKYIIFDLTAVSGMDSSGKNVFIKVHRLLKSEGIKLVYAMADQRLIRKFQSWAFFSGTKHFRNRNRALHYVEDELLKRATQLSDKWLANDTIRRIFERQVLANVFNISVRSDGNFSSARLRPWSEKKVVSKGSQLFCIDDKDDNLYMVYDGEIEIEGRGGDNHLVFNGSFFNLDGLLISIGAMPGSPSTVSAKATQATVVLVVSRHKFEVMQKEDAPLAQKLLMALIAQSETNRAGKARVPSTRNQAISYVADPKETFEQSDIAQKILEGDDYEISLTQAQIETFSKLFDIMLQDCGPNVDELSIEQFATYVTLEAHLLGSQLKHEEFVAMVKANGVDENGDGTLTKKEFLRFLQGLFLAKIPSSQLSALRSAYDAEVSKAPDQPMDEDRAKSLYTSLGFDVNISAWHSVIGVLDANGDGEVDFYEFLAGVGMMKKAVVLSSTLDTAFRQYKSAAATKMLQTSKDLLETTETQKKLKRRESKERFSRIMNPLTIGTFATKLFHQRKRNSSEENHLLTLSEGLALNAAELEAFLSIPRDDAEEMVFLADKDDVDTTRVEGTAEELQVDRTINKDEFQQLMQEWS